MQTKALMGALFQVVSDSENLKAIDLPTPKNKKKYKAKERSAYTNKRKLSNEDVLNIVHLLKNNETIRSIALKYNIHHSMVYCIKNGTAYAWLTGLDAPIYI